MSWNRLRFCLVILTLTFAGTLHAQQSFTLDQVLGAPFLNELTASKTGHRLAWGQNHKGPSNVWVADGPAFAARQLTRYNEDDGLVARLRPRGVHIEQLIFPDKVHDFLLYSNWLRALEANSDFFDRQFSWPQE